MHPHPAREQHAEALAEAFLTRSAGEWECDLAGRDVACVRADGANVAEFAVDEEANRELGFTVRVEHPTFGEYWRHGPIVTLDSAPPKIWPACEPGEHTRQILAELGYAPTEIERLKDAGVVGWPEGAARTHPPAPPTSASAASSPRPPCLRLSRPLTAAVG